MLLLCFTCFMLCTFLPQYLPPDLTYHPPTSQKRKEEADKEKNKEEVSHQRTLDLGKPSCSYCFTAAVKHNKQEYQLEILFCDTKEENYALSSFLFIAVAHFSPFADVTISKEFLSVDECLCTSCR